MVAVSVIIPTFNEGPNVAPLVARLSALENLDDVQDYAGAIQNAGYATDPAYADKLVSVVRKLAAG